jgi:hypothetical protein
VMAQLAAVLPSPLLRPWLVRHAKTASMLPEGNTQC